MGNKILGLDLGTNSIGWAVVEEDNNQFNLLDKGVRIFQEGVKIEKGNESSKAAERTTYRAARRLKYRRKLRKIAVLSVLSEYGYCPVLTTEELNEWRYKKVYPQNEAFRKWWLTDNQVNRVDRLEQVKNPYYFRNLVVENKLDLSEQNNRFVLGRVFYHIAQRRGFLSNRLEGTKESDGAVKKAINEISEAKGDRTLGQYFYEKYLQGEKIRDQYTHREEHYLDEFDRICKFQNLPKDLIEGLYNAIFYQRPLRSQKGLVGKCVFEPRKPRCAVSRPEFEEYRMLCFINNIKIKTPLDEKLRPLNAEERKKVKGLFFRKKDHFDFDDIAKKIAPKKQYKYFKDRNRNPEDWLFNYSMKTTVSGCPVSARFKDYFGLEFMSDDFNYVIDKDGRMPKKITDAWHALFTFDSDEKLKGFANNKLGLSDEIAGTFIDTRLKQDYASLSLKAINKITPYLREGLIYSHAVFLANMEAVVPEDVWGELENREIIRSEIRKIINDQNEYRQIIDAVNGVIKNARENGESWSNEAAAIFKTELLNKVRSQIGEKRFESLEEQRKKNIETESFHLLQKQMQKNLGKGEFAKVDRIDDRVKQFLSDNFEIDYENVDKLYHPSAVDVYKQPVKNNEGYLLLNSPMVSSIRNPMAMRALHQLRKVVNELIVNEIVDPNTKINIEMSRGLLNANERTGLKRWQNDRENKRKDYVNRIKEYYASLGSDIEPSEDDVLKYQLWEEQNHKCIYTGLEIEISSFLGADPKFDIEHTIPRSVSLDNSQENKTLCDSRFNRAVKKNKIPFELDNHHKVLARIECWKEKYEELEIQIQRAVRNARSAADKESKDRAIQARHKLTQEKNYWYNKYKRFVMEDVPSGFKNSQLVDIGIITKYSRMYLNTLFNRVYTVKGSTVADFRRMWGVQNEYEKKARINHVHHCVDAVTIACMTKKNYENLAKFYHDWEENYLASNEQKPKVDKPWATFVEDVKAIENELLVSHYTADVLPKPAKKALRKRGKIVRDSSGNPVYQKGDSVRGALHKETFYGAIERKVENKKGEIEKQIKYVVRKSLEDIKKADLDKIVDEAVKEKVKKAVDDKILILSSSDTSKNKFEGTVWMNEEKKVPIKKVRVYQLVTNPIPIKEHRDIGKSTRNYKNSIYVTTGGNYSLIYFEGRNNKGKVIRDYQITNNLEAAKYFKDSVQKVITPKVSAYEGLVEGRGLPVKAILKVGQMVLFYNKRPEEIWELDSDDRSKRLYKIIGFEGDGRIQFRFHQTAMQQSSQNKDEMTIKKYMQLNELKNSVVNYIEPVPWLRLTKGGWDMLIQGVDFNIDSLGKITKCKL